MTRGSGDRLVIKATHLLNATVSIERREMASDGMGGQTSTWHPHGRLRCRISQPTDEQLRVAVQEQRRFSHRVYFEPGADVHRGDQVTTDDGFVMRVEAVVDPSEPAYRRAECLAAQEGY